MLYGNVNELLAKNFGDFLKKSNYKFIYNSIAGSFCMVEPWIDELIALELISKLHKNDRIMTEFLLLGISQKKEDMVEIFGEEGIRFILDSYLGKELDNFIEATGYVILPISSLYLIVTLPSNYTNAKFLYSNIYIGSDSIKLMKYVKNEKFMKVLDLCAGSGIQGFNLYNQADKIISVELNDVSYNSILINQKMNGISYKKFQAVKNDLNNYIENCEDKFDCIICNPPFVPSPKSIPLPMCGDGGEDGLNFVRSIVKGYNTILNFRGKGYLVLECVGNDEGPFVLDCMKSILNKGIINIALFNRQPIEFQAHATANIAASIDQKNENYNKYFDEYMNMFKSYKATFIYPTVIEYIKEDCDLRVNYLGNYNKWSLDSKISVSDDLVIKEITNDKRYAAYINNEKKVVFNDQLKDILSNNQSKTIRELIVKDNDIEIENIKNVLPILNLLDKKGIINKLNE